MTGFVYRSVRGITRGIGQTINFSLTQLDRHFGAATKHNPEHDAIRAAINGVIGDKLAATNNPLAIQSQLIYGHQREPNHANKSAAKTHVIVMVHGLCMNDQQWTRHEHNHGEQLGKLMDAQTIYFVYNSGQSIKQNGQELAQALEQLMANHSTPISRITLLCHSMGGLVCRRAWQYAQANQLKWAAKLKTMVFIGTPHQGAQLERAGQWVERHLRKSPYSAPFIRITKMRSVGIHDLCNGIPNSPIDALPEGVDCFAIAGTNEKQLASPKLSARFLAQLKSDGLVTVSSAMGDHQIKAKNLQIPLANRLLVFETNHFELLESEPVLAQLKQWLVH